MNGIFNFIISTREAFIKAIDDLSLEQINKTPDGFSNNIIWNFGHIVVSSQILCYLRSGVIQDQDTLVIKYADEYKSGSKPTHFIEQNEFDELKSLAFSSIEKIKSDYENGLFKNVQPFSTMTYG